MKKSRIFMGVAALSLVVAGVFANKTARKSITSTIFYFNNSLNDYYAVSPSLKTLGCIGSTILTGNSPGLGAQQVQVKVGSTGSSFPLYYKPSTNYLPLFNKVF